MKLSFKLFLIKYYISVYLIGICQASHTTHDTKDVVVGSIDSNLSSLKLDGIN
jgi:hypothetical protein